MDFLSTHPLLAAFAVTLSFEGSLCLLYYTFTPACGKHCTALVHWWKTVFTDPIKEDAKFVPPRTVVHREIDEPRTEPVAYWPTPEQVERARKIADFEFETQVLPFRKPRRLEVN